MSIIGKRCEPMRMDKNCAHKQKIEFVAFCCFFGLKLPPSLESVSTASKTKYTMHIIKRNRNEMKHKKTFSHTYTIEKQYPDDTREKFLINKETK